jgi:hypothetical protein
MMRILICSLGLLLVGALAGCEDDSDIVTTRDVVNDPYGGLAALDEILYTTNHDSSGNAGSQVSLFFYPLIGVPERTEIPLALNGCGYLAMASDGENLLLQVHGEGRTYAVSPQGEVRWLRRDTELSDRGWRACGIGRRADRDEVVALFRRADGAFITRTYNLDLSEVVATSLPFTWGLLAGAAEPRTLIHDGTSWLLLATNAAGHNVLAKLDNAFLTIGTPRAVADDITGLAVADGAIWAAYTDGHVAQLRPVSVR